MWKRLQAVFISGLLALLPLGLTYFVIRLLYQAVVSWLGSGGFLGGLIRSLLGTDLPEPFINALSLLIILLVILLVGALTRIYVGRTIYHYFERVLLAIPGLRKLYATLKQFTDAVFNREMSAFKRVVLVEYPSKGLYMVGFVTNQQVPGVEEVVGEKMVSVFIMSPPNPITGMWLILPEKDVTYLDHITVEEGFRMVMSLGISIPPEVRKRLLARGPLPQASHTRAGEG
jgi:uncharacterized membrane protein